jgi:hypothetical protein
LRVWKKDADLQSVRNPALLTQLSDEERNAWMKFWSDVDELLNKLDVAANSTQHEDIRS